MASREELVRGSLQPQESEHAHKHHRKGHRKSVMHANLAESLKIRQVRNICSHFIAFAILKGANSTMVTGEQVLVYSHFN